jgi:hypothetical protein
MNFFLFSRRIHSRVLWLFRRLFIEQVCVHHRLANVESILMWLNCTSCLVVENFHSIVHHIYFLESNRNIKSRSCQVSMNSWWNLLAHAKVNFMHPIDNKPITDTYVHVQSIVNIVSFDCFSTIWRRCMEYSCRSTRKISV